MLIAASIIHLDATLIIEVILFVIFLALLNRLFYQPLSTVIQQRAEHVEEGLRADEESQRRAEETRQEVRRQIEQARAEAQGLMAAVTKDVAAQRQALMAQAKDEADAQVRQAQEAIRHERQAAIDELRRESGQLAILAASKVIGVSLDTAANRELADRAVADVGGLR